MVSSTIYSVTSSWISSTALGNYYMTGTEKENYVSQSIRLSTEQAVYTCPDGTITQSQYK